MTKKRFSSFLVFSFLLLCFFLSSIGYSAEQEEPLHQHKEKHTAERKATQAKRIRSRESEIPSPEPTQCQGCFSLIPPGCIESRVYKDTLNYEFKVEGKGAIKNDTVQPWHDQTLETLRTIVGTSTLKSKKFNHNLAVCGLQIIFETPDGQLRYTPYITLTGERKRLLVFISGMFSDLFKKEDEADTTNIFTYQDGQKEAELRSIADYFNSEIQQAKQSDSPIDIKQLKSIVQDQMQQHLRMFFGDNPYPSQLHPSVIEKRSQEVGAAASLDKEQELSVPPRFPENFYHSEQALLLHLLKQGDKVIDELIHGIPPGSVIHLLSINIVSDRQMCFRCAPTYVKFAEGASEFKKYLADILKSKGFNIPSEGVKLFTEISALRIFALPQATYRELQTKHSAETINVNTIQPHVVQQQLQQGERE